MTASLRPPSYSPSKFPTFGNFSFDVRHKHMYYTQPAKTNKSLHQELTSICCGNRICHSRESGNPVFLALDPCSFDFAQDRFPRGDTRGLCFPQQVLTNAERLADKENHITYYGQEQIPNSTAPNEKDAPRDPLYPHQ